MSTLLLAMILLTAADPQFEVRTLEGETLVGTIVKLDSAELTFQTADGLVSLETDKLMELSPKDQPDPWEQEPQVWVELVGGSSLLAGQYTSSNGQAQVRLSDGQLLELPTAAIATVRLQTQPEAVAAEWSRILGMKVDSDLLVVRKGDSLDYHKGVLRGATEKVVQFELDGDVLAVKRSKVHGLRYRHPAGEALPETVCQITDATGSRWSAQSLALPGELQWTTASGLEVSRPLAMVARIDFSAGKIVYLSDLQPESLVFTPYFGNDRGLPSLAKFFAFRVDKNLESGPLQLDSKPYDKGLALHSRTKVVYRLPGRFRRLQATVGIDDGVRPRGHVQLVIYGDKKVLLESPITGTDPPKPIDLDLSGVRRITILVDFGENFDAGDHLDLCNARVLK